MTYSEKYTNTKINEGIQELRDEIVRLNSIISTSLGKIAEVRPCKELSGYYFSPERYNKGSGWGATYNKSSEAVYTEAIEEVNKLLETSRNIHKANEVALASNLKLTKDITKIMQEIGIPKDYNTYEFKTPRASKKTEQYHIAGYKQDLNRLVICQDGIENEERLYKEFIRRIEEYKKEEKKKEDKILADKKLEEEKVVKHKQLMKFILKYNLSDNSEWSDILEKFFEKDKYIRLAHYLSKNRGDWTDGCSYADTGIDGFEIENEIDKEIIADLLTHVGENWDGDGRCFRDTKWNYGEIFALANKEILVDYDMAIQNMPD